MPIRAASNRVLADISAFVLMIAASVQHTPSDDLCLSSVRPMPLWGQSRVINVLVLGIKTSLDPKPGCSKPAQASTKKARREPHILCVCVCVCVYVFMYVGRWTCGVCGYVSASVYEWMHSCIYAYVWMCMSMCIYPRTQSRPLFPFLGLRFPHQPL